MCSKVSKIYICKEKGSPREALESAILEEEIGLVGDCYSGLGDKNRQVTILLSKDKKDIEENYKDRGICSKRFHENILIDNLILEDLSIGTKLKVGKSSLEITSIGKRCFSECELVKEQNICPLKRGAIFAKVIESGKIKVNDFVEICKY